MNWSLVFACVTAASAVAALFFSGFQTLQSNKQSLFDRRIKVWSISKSLIELYVQNANHLARRSDDPEFSTDLLFVLLTNNSYLCGVSGAVSHVLDESIQKRFLRKLEDIRTLSVEASLLFKRSQARFLSDFLDAYQSALFVMYQYCIILDNMQDNAGKFHWTLDKAIERLDETTYRNNLYDACKRIQDTYEALKASNVEAKIEKQIKLSRWS